MQKKDELLRAKAVAQKMQVVAQKCLEVIKENVARSKEQDERIRNESGQGSGMTKAILVCSVLILLFGCSASTIAILIGSSMFFSSPAVSVPAVLTQMEQEIKIVDVAKKEQEESAYNIGGHKYKDWYGVDGNWCAIFVSWCSNECGYLEDDIMPKSVSVLEMSDWYKEKGLWKDAGEYIPKAGDIIFFQNDMSHVGIVIGYDARTKIVTTIEGNAGSVDTSVEQPHQWVVEVCQICGGDHLESEEEICSSCFGRGYLVFKSGTENVYDDCSSIMKYVGCGSCGGSGIRTDYYNQYGCAFSEGNLISGVGKSGTTLVCLGCYNLPDVFGKASRCTNIDCEYSVFGAWEDYPNGVCNVTNIEYHEGSMVLEKSYPLMYEKISGYGLPVYPYQVKSESGN